MLYLHVTLVPFIDAAGELKTKPTQHSVNELRRIGIHPDIVVARSRDELSHDIREKIALFADVEPRAVIACRDVPDVYLVPVAAPGRRARHARLPSSSAADRRRRSRRVAGADRPDRATARGGRDRAGRQVREAPRRLPLRARGAEARRHVTRAAACACAGSTRRGCRSRRRPDTLEQVDGVLVPGGFGSRGLGGEDPRLPRRARARHPVPRHLPRHARRRLRVRAARGRARGRELHRDGSRDAAPGDRPASRAEGDRGPRRHDATGRPGGRARGRHPRTRRLRRVGRPRAPPAPVRGQQPLPARPGRGRARRLRDVPGGPAGRDRRAARPSLVRGQPVPPRVQVTADEAGAALPRLRRRGARPRARAGRRRRSGRRASGPRRRRRPRALPRARGDPEPAGLRACGRGRRAPRTCTTSGSRPTRTTRGRAIGATAGNISGPHPADERRRRAAGAALRAPRHGAADRRRSSRSSRTGSSATRPGRSSVPTTSRRSPSMLEAARRIVGEGRPHAGVELALHAEGGGRAARAPRPSTTTRLRARVGFVYDQAAPIGEVIARRADGAEPDVRFHGRAAHAGMAPEEGRSAIAAAARAIADLRLGRIDEETTANVGVIEGGVARNIVPEWCTFEAEARSHDERKLADLVQEMLDTFTFAAERRRVRGRDARRGELRRLPLPWRRPARAARRRRARALGLHPGHALSGGAADANVFNARGLPCVNLANGMADIHTGDEHIAVDDLDRDGGRDACPRRGRPRGGCRLACAVEPSRPCSSATRAWSASRSTGNRASRTRGRRARSPSGTTSSSTCRRAASGSAPAASTSSTRTSRAGWSFHPTGAPT